MVPAQRSHRANSAGRWRDHYTRKRREHKPSLFEAKDCLGKMIDWSLEDESLRVALFRFVDVLPSLESSAEIGRHLEEYFAKRRSRALGVWLFSPRLCVRDWLLAPVVRRNVVAAGAPLHRRRGAASFVRRLNRPEKKTRGIHLGRRWRGHGERRGGESRCSGAISICCAACASDRGELAC